MTKLLDDVGVVEIWVVDPVAVGAAPDVEVVKLLPLPGDGPPGLLIPNCVVY